MQRHIYQCQHSKFAYFSLLMSWLLLTTVFKDTNIPSGGWARLIHHKSMVIYKRASLTNDPVLKKNHHANLLADW